jgi:hypothetical protein
MSRKAQSHDSAGINQPGVESEVPNAGSGRLVARGETVIFALTRVDGHREFFVGDRKAATPDKFSRCEGCDWTNWTDRKKGDHIHAVIFPDGTLWDEVNGFAKTMNLPGFVGDR